jgi:putative ABC transport system permease protein
LTDIELAPDAISAFLVGTKSRIDTLNLKTYVDDYQDEPLTAIIPGMALSELWQGIGYAESTLKAVSSFVVLVGLLCMLIAIYNSLNERRREMAILRSVGAGPKVIFMLLITEAFLLSGLGILFGIICLFGLVIGLQSFLEAEIGLYLPLTSFSALEGLYILGILFLALVMAIVPAFTAYRQSLHDGLVIRI